MTDDKTRLEKITKESDIYNGWITDPQRAPLYKGT